MALLELDHLCKNFGSYTALADLSLQVRDCEFLVLVGPSGCGKSTLLRLIAGLEEPTTGKIRLNQRDLTNLAPKDRDVAMVFQNYALYPHLSVYENLAFGLKRRSKEPLPQRWIGKVGALVGYQTKEMGYIDAQVRQIAQVLKIEPLLSRRPSELSGGQKQRVALGRAMIRDPQVYLMDEPLSNLDAQLRTQMRTQIVQWQRELQTTTIYVTHDQTEAMTMGTRIAVMHQGKLQQLATPLEIYRAPANQFVAGFIGEPAMNFIPLSLNIEAGQARLVGPSCQIPLPAQYQGQPLPEKLVLGVRPEHWCLTADCPILQGPLALVEPLGSETLAICTTPAGPVNLRLSPEYQPRPQEVLSLGIQIDRVHLFDAMTGERLVSHRETVD